MKKVVLLIAIGMPLYAAKHVITNATMYTLDALVVVEYRDTCWQDDELGGEFFYCFKAKSYLIEDLLPGKSGKPILLKDWSQVKEIVPTLTGTETKIKSVQYPLDKSLHASTQHTVVPVGTVGRQSYIVEKKITELKEMEDGSEEKK